MAVWNTSRTLKGGDVNLMAKAHTEVDVLTLKVSPADDTRLVLVIVMEDTLASLKLCSLY